MNTNITITLDTRRAKADGTFPIILRLGHNERTIAIPTGYSVNTKDWDSKNKGIKKSHQGSSSVTRINNIIQKQRADAMNTILKLHETGQLNTLSVSSLKERLINQNKIHSFIHFAKGVVAQLIKANKIGTARSYQGVINVLQTYTNQKDLSFHDISFSFLTKFEANHIANGNGANGLAVYMRTIRALYNKAIKEGVADKESYPFNDYKIKTVPTIKRALDWNFLQKIVALELHPEHPCFTTRNYFLASYMMYGANFSDMAHLHKTDIINGRIQYRRRKTSKLYDIKITDTLAKIINYYTNKTKDSPFVFPIIKGTTAIEQEKSIQWARKRYNKKLKVLGALCGIGQNLTSYVSRHSFATQAMMQDVPLSAISSMLGHSSIKTTEIYLKSLPTNVLDEYNERVLQHI